jgi:hypothetical protein
MSTPNRLRYSLCLALTGLGAALAAQFAPALGAVTAARLVFPPAWVSGFSAAPPVWPLLQFDFGDEVIEFSIVGMREQDAGQAPTLELQGCGERQLRLLESLDPHQRFRLFAPGRPLQWFQVTDHRLFPASQPIALQHKSKAVILRCQPSDRRLSPRHLAYLVFARPIDPAGDAGPVAAAGSGGRMH